MPNPSIIGGMILPIPRLPYAQVVLFSILAPLLALIAPAQVTLAQNPTDVVLVALAPTDSTSSVELVALTLDGDLTESDGHTILQGSESFKVHNTDTLQPVTLQVGFPAWAGGTHSFDPAQFVDFAVTVGSKKITLAPTNAPVKIGKEVRTVDWYSFDLTLDPDEKNVLTVTFTQDLGSDILPRFTYGLLPSSGWKGPIGSARLTINLPAQTTAEQFVALDPSVPQFDGEKLTWLWTNFNPEADPGVTLVRPSVWADLLDKRAASSASPNDPALHLALGHVYQQLAAEDSPRRDNFLSQAVAELETAARLDPKNVDATSTLAALYETRAGPPSGPRDANYVALALSEWQALIGSPVDADARKNSAEDSFYLGVAAQSRGENDQALKYLQEAANFSPQGAGPLYTKEHWATEMQAVRIALARAAEQQGQIVTSLGYARAAFGNDFDLAPAPPMPSFALDHADVVTSNAERQITISLFVYPDPSEQARQAVDDVVAALNKTGEGAAAQVATDSDYGLKLTVPFSSDRDLMNRLTVLANAFPQKDDWNVVKGVVQSSSIDWTQQIDTFRSTMEYNENVDLASGQGPIQNDLNKLSQAIGELETAAPTDDRSQLRLALLRDSQQWWQRQVIAGSVSFLLLPDGAPARRWNVPIGDRASLTYEDSEVRPEWYVVGGLVALIVLMVILLLATFLRARRRPREV